MSGHGVEMLTYFWKDQISLLQWSYCQWVLFYFKNCSSRNLLLLPICGQINIWLHFILVAFPVSESEAFCGFQGRNAFSKLGQILSSLALCFLSLPGSTAGSCKFHFLLYVQILLITSTSLTPLLGVPAFLPSVLTPLFLTACIWSVAMPFLSVLQSGVLSTGHC